MTLRTLLVLLSLAGAPASAAPGPFGTLQSDGPSERAATPDAPRRVPVEILDGLRSDPAYRYERETPPPSGVSWSDGFWRWVGDWLERLFRTGDERTSSQAFRWVVYGLAAGLTAWVLLTFIRMERAGPFARREIATGAADTLADAARPANDLSALRAEAEASGRYREAVRWHYLLLLNRLSAATLLDLQPAKTNRRYRADLAAHPIGAEFARASRLFDRVVYGGAELDAERYAVVAERIAAVEAAIGGRRLPVAS